MFWVESWIVNYNNIMFGEMLLSHCSSLFVLFYMTKQFLINYNFFLTEHPIPFNAKIEIVFLVIKYFSIYARIVFGPSR